MKRLSIAEALREGLAEEMRRDKDVFCMGEDIGIRGGWGGVFTVTPGIGEEIPGAPHRHPDFRGRLHRPGRGFRDYGHASGVGCAVR